MAKLTALGPAVHDCEVAYASGFSQRAHDQKLQDEELFPKLKRWADYCRSFEAFEGFAYEAGGKFFASVGGRWYAKKYFDASVVR